MISFVLATLVAFTVTCPDKPTFLGAAGMLGSMDQLQESLEKKGMAPDVAAAFTADRRNQEFIAHGCTFDDKMPTKIKT